MKHFLSTTLTFALLLTACGGTLPEDADKEYVSAEKGDTFQKPDIKDDFCGIHINFQFCKCAFHDEYCDSIGMDQDSANAHVQSEYNNHVAELLDGFTSRCETTNGYMKGKTCYVCPADSVVENQKCLVPVVEEEEEDEEDASEETTKENCGNVDETWEKYSDFDYRIPVAERSYEAKEYARVQTQIAATYAEQAELVYETELLRTQLQDVKDYKAALVDNLRDNLVKATLRLAYVTYSQVKGAKGAGESFSKMLTSAEGIEALGAGMKAAQSVIPSDSRLAIDTTTVGGKVESIGWNATLEALESMGDPKKIAKQVAMDAGKTVIPSADITPEEVEILRQQNLENNLLDEVIAELEAKIAENEAWLATADVIIADLEAEAAKWSAEEKARVLLMLEDECE